MFGSSAEHPGVPSRPPASAHLMMSSTDRYRDRFDRLLKPTTGAKFTLQRPNNLLSGYFTRLAITQIQFQWNLPTIIEGVNDEFSLVFDETTTVDIVITPGWYTVDELATAIETEITDAGNYDEAWDFTCTVVDGALVLQAGVTMIPFIGPPGSSEQAPNNFLITAGLFVQDAVETAPSSGTFRIYGAPAPMLYTRWIDMCSRNLTQFQRVKDNTTLIGNVNDDVIARVYACPPNQILNNSYPGQLFSEPWIMVIDYNTPKHMKWEVNQAINNFDIELKDEFGQTIYWSTQYPTEFQLTMMASET